MIPSEFPLEVCPRGGLSATSNLEETQDTKGDTSVLSVELWEVLGESFPTRLPNVGVLVQVQDRFLYPSQPALWLYCTLLWRLEVPATS